MAAKISQFTINMQIFEVNILYASMKFNGVIDIFLIIKFVFCMPYLYTHHVVKITVIFQNGCQNLTVHN